MSMCVYRAVVKVDVFIALYLIYVFILSLHLGLTNLARLARQ